MPLFFLFCNVTFFHLFHYFYFTSFLSLFILYFSNRNVNFYYQLYSLLRKYAHEVIRRKEKNDFQLCLPR